VNVESVAEVLRAYIVRELLEGDGGGLTAETPLLEWGVLNSIEIAKLVVFISDDFGVHIPGEKVVPSNFRNLLSIAQLIASQASAAEAAGA
jgi:acyl carrier protein